jgi:thiamine-phosphate pyrophosphorylase
MRLIAFTRQAAGTSPAEEAAELAGVLPWVDALHVSKDAGTPATAIASLLKALPENDYRKIWLHDHYELAVEHGLGGIHISRRAAAANKALGIYAALHDMGASISCHRLEDLVHLSGLHERVFVCPVFDSISKPGHTAAFDLSAVKKVLAREHDADIIALGGVSPDKIDLIRDTGFDGVAVLGALWNAEDPIEFIKKMHGRCRNTVNTF